MDVSSPEVADQLDRIEASKGFVRAGRLVRFLRYITQETLAGRGEKLKEYTIATEVFERPSSYDPQVDSLVRVQASMLRKRLQQYYTAEGRDEPLRIEIPKGGYEPLFLRLPRPVSPPGRSRIYLIAAALGLVLAVAVAWLWIRAGAAAPPSVTVLPFADLSPAGDQAFLCDGIAEELIDALSHIQGLRVVARTSAFQYKGNAQDVRRIGKELRVRTVVEGSVRREGSTLRVTAELIDAKTGYHIWSAAYDRKLDDLLSVEREIARAVAGSLRAQRIETGVVHGSTPKPKAYQHYTTGLYWRATPTVDRLRKAAGEFSAAVETDSLYAPAQAALAEADARLYLTETVSAEESAVPARAAAAKAVELDDQLARAHEAAALVHLIDWDFAGADREYHRALQLDPSDVRTRFAYAQLCLSPSGRYQDAMEQLRKAIDLDPVSRNLITELGATYRMAGEPARARELFRQSLDLEPMAYGTRTNLAATDAMEGLYSKAVASLEAVNNDAPGDPWIMGHLGYAYAKAGRSADARRVLGSLTANSTAALHIAAVYSGLGEPDRALDWLQRGVAARSPSMFWLRGDFRFAPLRSNPHYSALLANYP
jgi:serine/threonine-protein kinase